METTTPEKSKNNQNATSLGKLVDSPTIFDFLNTLSPIKPVKPMPFTQIINHPLTFSFLQAVFTTPHATSDPSRLEFSTKENKAIVDGGHMEITDPTVLPNNHQEWSAIIAELMRSPEHISEHASNTYHTSDPNLEGVGSTDQINVSTSLCNLDVVISKHSNSSYEHPMQNTLMFSDSCSESGNMENEEINPSGSKKRRRSEEAEEGGGSCKRCTCKKSKCLKLYCQCFSAGVYCTGGTCACVNCFNMPIHKDTVFATRKQMEARNPFAFAPKVISGLESLSEIGDDFGTTPESGRHKRGGCNCKKSGCLKKYCECYQSGVGCSIYCRCEGCKNSFGAKEVSGVLTMYHELEGFLLNQP